MVRFLKFKFQTILKLNFNGGQFYKKYIKFWLLQKIVSKILQNVVPIRPFSTLSKKFGRQF